MNKKYSINSRENSDQTVGSYDYEGLCHYFIYNYGRKDTASNRMSCTYNYIYSYNQVIAQMLERQKKDDTPVLLISSISYSSTTAKLQHLIRANYTIGDMKLNAPKTHKVWIK